MRAGTRAKGTLLYLCCFIVFLFVAPLVLAQEGAPALICQPNEGEYGLQFYIVGESFEPDSVVSIRGFDLTLASRTDGEGGFKVITFAPTDESQFPVGEYEIIASDEAGSEASCTFRLREIPTPFRPTAVPQVETPTPLPTPTVAPTVAPTLAPTPSAGSSPLLIIGLTVATALGLALLAVAIFMIVARNRPAPARARPSSPSKAERTFSPSAPSSETMPFSPPKADVTRDTTLPEIQASKEDATLMVSALPVLTTQATLTVTRGVGKGTRFTVDKKTTMLGRGEDCDIIIAEAVVSRHHTKIVRLGPKYFLYDLKSTNGTLVNGQRVEQHVLEDGDEIQIGVTVFLFEQPGEEE